MIDALVPVASAALLGLMGSGHCLGMCGGIVSALSLLTSDTAARNAATQDRIRGPEPLPDAPRTPRRRLLLSYHLGRIASYALMGALAAGLAAQAPASGWPLARTLAGLLLVAMGLYLLNLWRGLQWLELGGHWLWRRLQPLGQRLLPLDSVPKGLAIGMLWGWLPCGLVYSALAYGAAQAHAGTGALVMLGFGLGTLPALWLSGTVAGQLKSVLNRPGLRRWLAAGFVAMGLWTLAAAWWHTLAHGDHSGHHGHSLERNENSLERHEHSPERHNNSPAHMPNHHNHH